jgi:hypothetical protein
MVAACLDCQDQVEACCVVVAAVEVVVLNLALAWAAENKAWPSLVRIASELVEVVVGASVASAKQNTVAVERRAACFEGPFLACLAASLTEVPCLVGAQVDGMVDLQTAYTAALVGVDPVAETAFEVRRRSLAEPLRDLSQAFVVVAAVRKYSQNHGKETRTFMMQISFHVKQASSTTELPANPTGNRIYYQ